MSSEQKAIKVKKDSLPISCPPKGTPARDLHPRVYIEMTSKGGSSCPYCGNHFEFED